MSDITARRGGWLTAKVRKLVAAGNVRSMILKRDGKIVDPLRAADSREGTGLVRAGRVTQ